MKLYKKIDPFKLYEDEGGGAKLHLLVVCMVVGRDENGLEMNGNQIYYFCFHFLTRIESGNPRYENNIEYYQT